MEVETTAPRAAPSTREPTRLELLQAFTAAHADAIWFLALSLFAGLVYLRSDIITQPLPHDTTFHIYAGQQMLIGHAIYRDVAIIKAPLSDFGSALAILAARAAGITDTMGARIFFLLVAMASVGVTFLAGRTFFGQRAIGVLAALIMAGYDFFGFRAVTGPEPKALLILFGLAALILIQKRRWFWAGMCAALATLAWQPGAMLGAIVVAAALAEPFLGAGRDVAHTTPQNTRRRRAVRQGISAIAGSAIPFALLFVYLIGNDALIAARNATIGANLVHFATEARQIPLLATFSANLAKMASDAPVYCFPTELPLVGFGALGFLGIVAAEIVQGASRRRVPINLERTPFILYALGFVVLSVVDYDFCPDLIPLLPVIAIGSGWLVWQFAALVGRVSSRGEGAQAKSRAQPIAFTAGAGVVLISAFWNVPYYQPTNFTYQDQQDVARVAEENLKPGDSILTFGDTIILTELHRDNASKILHLGSKSGLGVLAFEPRQVQGMIDGFQRKPPKLVSLARETRPQWTRPFYHWLNTNYNLLEAFPKPGIRLYIHKP